MKTKLSIFLGLAVSAALLYFAFRNVDFAKLRAIYGTVNNAYALPVAAIIFVELLLRGLRWKMLLDPAAPVRAWDAMRLETAGLALNNLLPMRLGEIMRGTTAAGFFRIPVMTVFATILVERAMDTFVIAALFALAAALGGTGGVLEGYGGYFWLLLGGLVAAIAALVFIDEIMSHHFLSGFFERFPRVKKLLANLALGVRAFHSPKTAAVIIALAFVQWSLDILNLYIMAFAFGIHDVMNFYKCAVVLFSTAVAASIPGMPGYFGNFEFAVAKVTGMWGVPGDVGFAYATYIHILTYLVVTILGLVFIYQMGQSLGRVWAQFRGGKAGE